MIVQGITELTVVGTFDRGVPNQERIVLRVNEILDLGQYGVMIGVRASAGSAIPVHDNLFWFGDGIVNPGDWLFIYTGPGTPKFSTLPKSTDRMFTVHWGRATTLFESQELVPILFRVDAVHVSNEIAALPAPAN